MATANVAAADAVQARLTDAVFAVKNAVEDRDVARLKALFAPEPQICVQGRFIKLPEFLERLQEFFKRVEHVSMDVARIEEIDPQQEGGFIAARVDFSWIDSKLWEEQTVHGLMSLTLAPARARRSRTKAAAGRREAAGQTENEMVGFSYQALHREGHEEEERPPTTGPAPTGDRGYPTGPFWF